MQEKDSERFDYQSFSQAWKEPPQSFRTDIALLIESIYGKLKSIAAVKL